MGTNNLADAARLELERLLASDRFRNAGRLGPFLRYLVEKTLAGAQHQLKEQVLGVEVFERQPGYDPRLDPIVRVEARRLRSRLEEYYAGEGRNSPLRIAVPKGTYVPVFTPSGAPRRRRVWTAVPLAAAVLLAGFGYWMFRQRPAPPRVAASIAVMPFRNVSPEPDNEYFSDGLTEELIDTLGRIEGLRVAARSSTFQYKGKSYDARQVGRELQAATILEGSVRKLANRVRISAQLIDTSNGFQLWSRGYDRELRDIFGLYEEIARDLAAALRVELRTASAGRRRINYAANTEAWNLYLRGRYHWNQYTSEGVRKAIEYFGRATAADPQHAPAYSMLASAHMLLGYYRVLPQAESWRQARDYARRAVEIDDSLGEAHAALGFVAAITDWDWTTARREFERALELSPNSSDVHCVYGLMYLLPRGRFPEAMAELRRALELDPVSVIAHVGMSHALLSTRDFPKAIEFYRRTVELSPSTHNPWWDMGMAYAYAGQRDQAREIFRKAASLEEPPRREPGAMELILLGELERARRLVARYEQIARDHRLRPVEMVRVYAGLGDHDNAFRWLDRAYQDHDAEILWIKVDPRYENLRADQRFVPMLKRIGIE